MNHSSKGKCFLFFFILISSLFASRANYNVSCASADELRIGVASGVFAGTLHGENILVVDSGQNRVALSGNVKLTLSPAHRLLIMGKEYILPVTITSSTSIIGWDNTRYRGSLKLLLNKNGTFNVINQLGVEDYLRGVLKMEMNPKWPLHALKAQAILARTYAMANRSRHAKEGYDLCALSHCQHYRGVNAETIQTDNAVRETAGRVLLWGNKPAFVYYHADSGGATSDHSSVWKSNIPYLTPKKEPFSYKSPYSQWSAQVRPSQIETALAKINKNVGSVQKLVVLSRDASNRVLLLEIQGSLGRTRMSGYSFRMGIGSSIVKSTHFYIDNASGERSITRGEIDPTKFSSKETSIVELMEAGVFSSKELMDMLIHPEKKPFYFEIGRQRMGNADIKQTKHDVVAASANDVFSITGSGWGHGVGLSQWGAKAMAEQGWNYEQILSHYFPGTQLSR